MPPSSESVTVTVLPDVLALVHIPRSRLKSVSHQLVKQILSPKPSFLNITCNKLELSLFAHKSTLSEFEVLARKDRQRHRRSASFRRPRARSQGSRNNDPVEVSYDTWNVVQIDSHNDRLDNAGARVRELSAPIAEAGLSILYQSSYMSDFIFVKSSCLDQVLSRLAQTGFVEYSNDITSHFLSVSPTLKDDDIFSLDLQPDLPSDLGSVSALRRRSIETSLTSLVLQRDEIPPPKNDSPSSEATTVISTPSHSTFSPCTSGSPCPDDVQILEPALACVGLSDSCSDIWASKIIKLVAYPELITCFPPVPSKMSLPDVDNENYDRISPLDEIGIGYAYDKTTYPPQPVPYKGSSTASLFSSPPSSLGTSSSSSGEDGYFSSASLYSASGSTPSLVSSRSFPEISDMSSTSSRSRYLRRPRLDRINTSGGSINAQQSSAAVEDSFENAVPFFSFTRTAEGSSLTTSLEVIAALFPPSERHMVICSDELAMMDEDCQFQHGTSAPASSTMKCLQIDLQKFGLDKHGLISRFSKILDSNGINHMYYSTYKTANLLVDKADALHAQTLLRSC